VQVFGLRPSRCIAVDDDWVKSTNRVDMRSRLSPTGALVKTVLTLGGTVEPVCAGVDSVLRFEFGAHRKGTMQAIWNGQVLAESNETQVVEGNQYFPPSSLDRRFFTESATTTVCPWKGTASYYNVEVDGKVNKDAAWLYVTPKTAAANIAGYVAFWKGVEVKAFKFPISSIQNSDDPFSTR